MLLAPQPGLQDLTSSVPHDERVLDILERDWHLDLIEFLHRDMPRLVAVLVLAFLLLLLIRFLVSRMHTVATRNVANARHAAQMRTMASILRATGYIFVALFVLLQVLPIFNIDLKPLLASVSIIGLGVSFGAQSIFKDIFNGIYILIEDQYTIGDFVKVAGLSGTVEQMSLRSTTLRDADGTMNIIPNSQVTTVQNLSRHYSMAILNVSVDASANPDQVIAALTQLADQVRHDAAFKDLFLAEPTVPGIDRITGSEAFYTVLMRVRANQRDGVLRELRRRILVRFAEQNIPLGNTQPTLVLQK